MNFFLQRFLVLVALSPQVYSANVTAPFELENTMVLPVNVRNPRVRAINFGIEDRFGPNGELEPLGKKLNKAVLWSDVLEALATSEERASAEGILEKYGLTETPGPGETLGTVNLRAMVTVPSLAWGITDRFLLALAVPVYNLDLSVAKGFRANDAGNQFISGIEESSSPAKAEESANRLNAAIDQKLSRLGYNSLESKTIQGVGDIRLVGKILAYQEGPHAIALRPSITLPTGTVASEDSALELGTGDGQTDLSMRAIYDFEALHWLRFNAFTDYTFQTPQTLTRRIPKSKSDSLSADKENVYRKLGDLWVSNVSVNFGRLSRGFSLGAGYTYQQQQESQIIGAQFSRDRYDALQELNPFQDMHSLTFTLGFSTIDWYKAKDFVLPLQTFLTYTQPLSGTNVGTGGLISAELVMFF